jgi:hypothetical protein
MTVKITRLSLSAADLREEAAATEDAKTARRMLAIALLLDGLVAGSRGGGVCDGSPDTA